MNLQKSTIHLFIQNAPAQLCQPSDGGIYGLYLALSATFITKLENLGISYEIFEQVPTQQIRYELTLCALRSILDDHVTPSSWEVLHARYYGKRMYADSHCEEQVPETSSVVDVPPHLKALVEQITPEERNICDSVCEDIVAPVGPVCSSICNDTNMEKSCTITTHKPSRVKVKHQKKKKTTDVIKPEEVPQLPQDVQRKESLRIDSVARAKLLKKISDIRRPQFTQYRVSDAKWLLKSTIEMAQHQEVTAVFYVDEQDFRQVTNLRREIIESIRIKMYHRFSGPRTIDSVLVDGGRFCSLADFKMIGNVIREIETGVEIRILNDMYSTFPRNYNCVLGNYPTSRNYKFGALELASILALIKANTTEVYKWLITIFW